MLHYTGPTDVQWHAKAHINTGANFYIVGQHPTEMSHLVEKRDIYDVDHGKKVSSMAPGLERLNILSFRMRTLAKNKENPLDGFMCPGGRKVLVADNGKVPEPIPA